MTAKAKYSDRHWQRLKGRVKREEPYCPGVHDERCGQPTEDVHHLDGQGLNGPRGYDRSNLQALCHSCHSRITAAEHGWGTRPKRARPASQHPGLVG